MDGARSRWLYTQVLQLTERYHEKNVQDSAGSDYSKHSQIVSEYQ